jgi:BirA family biotin operon repressor/biotin-[acetyl-CoA-carboxylase] ligase
VLWKERKLGGILLEFGGESSGPCHIVVGVGLNVAMPPDAAQVIDQPWVDLRGIVGRGQLSRNTVAARLLSEIARAVGQFERDGLERLRQDWQRFDLTAGKRVRVRLPSGDVTGIARGVDEFGALMLETPSGMQRFVAGEVSLRFEE